MVENTQKIAEDKAQASSSGWSKTIEDKGKQIRDNEEEGTHYKEEDDSKFIFVNPYTEKIEKF